MSSIHENDAFLMNIIRLTNQLIQYKDEPTDNKLLKRLKEHENALDTPIEQGFLNELTYYDYHNSLNISGAFSTIETKILILVLYNYVKTNQITNKSDAKCDDIMNLLRPFDFIRVKGSIQQKIYDLLSHIMTDEKKEEVKNWFRLGYTREQVRDMYPEYSDCVIENQYRPVQREKGKQDKTNSIHKTKKTKQNNKRVTKPSGKSQLNIQSTNSVSSTTSINGHHLGSIPLSNTFDISLTNLQGFNCCNLDLNTIPCIHNSAISSTSSRWSVQSVQFDTSAHSFNSYFSDVSDNSDHSYFI